MAHQSSARDARKHKAEVIAPEIDKMLRKALTTPPISNEDILKRSKESHGKGQRSK
jgi:hypothetical protein